MEKTAQNDYPLHDLLHKRWSPRAFADKAVPPETLLKLLEAARWSASCFNDQPWAYLVATKDQPELYAKLLACLIPFNQDWAKSAPVLMISLAHQKFAHNGKPNIHGTHDTGAASAQLTAQATAEGLFVHQMGGIEYDKIRTDFALPDDWNPIAGIAIGYLGDPNTLSDQMKERELAPNPRKKLSEFVFGGKFGDTSTIVGESS